MQSQPTVLVVEDQPSERDALSRMLRLAQYNVISAAQPDEALAHVDAPVDLVISDLRLGEMSGLDLLRGWKDRQPDTPFILITAYGDVPSAVEAMKLGAADYMTKPVNPEALLKLIEKWLETSRSGGRTAQADQPFGYAAATGDIGIPPGTSLEELERAAVERALEEHHGNRTHAAKTLGISVRTLQRKLKAWRIPMLSIANRSPQQPAFAPRH